MRFFISSFILISQVSLSLLAVEIHRFTPLEDNERFAYTIQSMHDSEGRSRMELTLYSVRNNNVGDISQLFRWEHVRWWDVIFTSDYKKVFFIGITRIGSGINAPQISNLYMANGHTGEIRRIISNNLGNAPLRVSQDGRFIIFQRLNFRSIDACQFYLFDVFRETVVGEFIWRPNKPEYFMKPNWPVNGWRFIRVGNIFRIIAIFEASGLLSVADFDPETQTFIALWNYPEKMLEISFPDYDGSNALNWLDDIHLQKEDRNIMLRDIW